MKRLILTAALGLGLALPAMAQARASLPDSIYFWGSTAVAISVPKGQGPRENTRVIRPSVLYMTFDGSWLIDALHWSGWGSSVATLEASAVRATASRT